MLYKEPFVIYLNISVCIILLFLALPSLLNRKEELSVRLAFSFIFFTVIVNCTTNVLILLLENYQMVPVVFMTFFVPLLFGPAVYFYIKNLLGIAVRKNIYMVVIPGVISFCYGIFLIFADNEVKQHILRQIILGEHAFFNINNVLTLIFIMVYCVKAWGFLKKRHIDEKDKLHLQSKLKKSWAKEFIICVFTPVFIFSIIHSLVLTDSIRVSTMDMDLIWMPVFILFVYLLVAVRNMMMHKEFEHQFVLANIENEKQIQDQRLEIARDLHDSLGAQLTFVNTVLDGLKNTPLKPDITINSKIDLLSALSENSIEDLKNTLWVLNSKEIYLDDLKTKMLNFIKNASEAKEDVKFDFNFDIMENIHLNSKQAINLFRAVQEIINNAIKYADATEIKIEVVQDLKDLTLKISDNGKGFDYEKEKNKSFGLQNIKTRIEAVNGTMNLETTIGLGTKYFIQLILTT